MRLLQIVVSDSRPVAVDAASSDAALPWLDPGGVQPTPDPAMPWGDPGGVEPKGR